MGYWIPRSGVCCLTRNCDCMELGRVQIYLNRFCSRKLVLVSGLFQLATNLRDPFDIWNFGYPKLTANMHMACFCNLIVDCRSITPIVPPAM